MRNVSFIRSDSVLTGRDISRRRDDLGEWKKMKRMEHGSITAGLIRTNLLARVRLLRTSSAKIVLVTKRVGRISS